MNGVIFTAHGNFPSGLYSGLKFIAGDLENVKAIDFLEEDGLDGLDKKLSEALESLKECNNIIILTDLAGGTPFNRSVLLTTEMKNIKVIGGTNFQMLYTAAFESSDNLEELYNAVIDAGHEGITCFEMPSKENDESEDGI